MRHGGRSRNRTPIRPWTPYPTGIMLSLMAVGAFATFVAARSYQSWPPVTWRNWQLRYRDCQVIVAALASLLGALMVTPLRRTSALAPPCVSRDMRMRLLHLYAWLWLWVQVTYGIGLIPLTVRTLKEATAGTPDVLAWLSAVAGLSMWPALGMMLGMMIPRRGVVVVSALAALLCIGVPKALSEISVGFSMLSIAPVWRSELPFVGEQANPLMMWSRIVLFCSWSVLFVVAGGVYLDDPDDDCRRRLWVSLRWLSVPLALCLCMIAAQPNLVVIDKDAHVTCEHAGHIAVCSYAEDSRALRVAMPIASEAYDAFLPQEHVVIGVLGLDASSSQWKSDLGDFADARIVPTTYIVTNRESNYRRALIDDLSSDIAGAQACYHYDGHGEVTMNSDESQELAWRLKQRVIQYVTHGASGYAAALRNIHDASDPFNGTVADTDLLGWYGDHADRIASCSLTEKDLS